jgi:hypothetical protein
MAVLMASSGATLVQGQLPWAQQPVDTMHILGRRLGCACEAARRILQLVLCADGSLALLQQLCKHH